MYSPATDPVAALARLLADPALRARFHADRRATLVELLSQPSDRALLATLDADGLERQAQALVAKRRGEVARLLPQTFARGGGSVCAEFEHHATRFWPVGHRRHLEDALAFAGHLRRIRHPALRPAELNRVCFALGRRRLALHWLGSLRRPREHRPGLQLLLRRRGDEVRELNLLLAG